MHAFTAASRRRLDEHGIGQGVGLCQNLAHIAREAECDGDAVVDGQLSGRDLVAHEPHGFGVGTDEDEVVLPAGIGKLGILRKEAIAGVDGVGASVQGGVDDLLDVEVGVFETAVAEGIGFVGQTAVQCLGVVVGEDGYALDV